MANVRLRETVSVLEKLNFDKIESDWVKDVWESDFTELLPVSMSDDHECLRNASLNTELCHVLKVLEGWASEEGRASEESFWTVLVENDLPHKNLIAYLCYILDTGSKITSNGFEKESALLAAHIYATLILLPGSGAFKVFHPLLFQKATDTLKLTGIFGASKRKRKPTTHSQGPRKKNRGKQVDLSEEFDSSDEDDGCDLTQQEVIKLQQRFMSFLKGYVRMLHVYSLKVSPSSSQHVVEVLMELTTLDQCTVDFDSKSDVRSLKTISQLAYRGLYYICAGFHGDVTSMTTMVFKYLLTNILMGDTKQSSQAITKESQLIKDVAVAFCCHLLDELGDNVLQSIRILVQHLCVRCPDRAESRQRVAQAVVDLMMTLNNSVYAKLIEWIHTYSRNAKINYRVFGLDIASLLLTNPERQPDDSCTDSVFLSHRFLLQMILSRCSDIAPTVRARAIAALAQCSCSPQPMLVNALREIVTPKTLGRQPVTRLVPTPVKQDMPPSEENAVPNSEARETQTSSAGTAPGVASTSVLNTIQLTPGGEVSIPDAQGFVTMLRQRTADEKVNVRKAALQAIENIVRLSGIDFNAKDLDVIKERCRDPALSVRKQAQISLTALLNEMPLNKVIQRAWLEGVLPMVLDRETSAQEKCLELLEPIILNNVCGQGHDEQGHMTWSMLGILASDQGAELRRFLQKAFQMWNRQGKLKSSSVTFLQQHVNTANNAATWLMLAEITTFVSKFNAGFVIDYWKKHLKSLDFDTLTRVLTVLGNVAKKLAETDRTRVIGDLQDILGQFNQPPQLITSSMSCMAKLYMADGDEAIQEKMADWCEDLMKKCDSFLYSYVSSDNADDSGDEDRVTRHLFTLGEAAQHCPNKVPKRLFALVQSLIATSPINVDGESQPVPASKLSNRIRAFAYITLGKLCLQHEDLAKKWVAALAREMETSTDMAIRNNVIIIMCDLCVRYTAVVDSYVPNIASCLKDKCPLIRKQTLILLTHLLQEDYVKWKGSLFYRFITTVIDEHSEIKELAQFCLVHILLQRKPTMFFHHFVECIFHFNSYDKHSIYNKFSQSEREMALFSLKGTANASRRMEVYKFMLENMTDEHKFQLSSKLCKDVLDAMVSGALPLDADSSAVLQDCLNVLCSAEIKLTSMRSRPVDDIVEEQDMAMAVMDKAKKSLISQVMRKNVIENVVPVVIGLKHLLEKHRSPVLKNLMAYLHLLMSDYKNDVKDILLADPQLAKEIEFDLKKFEQEQQASSEESSTDTTSARKSLTANAATGGVKTPARTRKSENGGLAAKAKTPIMMLHQPAASPLRTVSVSAMNVINSARKAMGHAQELKKPASSESTEDVSKLENEKTETALNKEAFVTPVKKNANARAISTPDRSVNDITFMDGGEHSMVAPSPIPTAMPIRVFGSSEPSRSSGNKGLSADLICMFSPDKPTPKPRTWKVKTPNRNCPDAMPADILTVDSDPQPQTRPKRSTRSKQR